VLRVEEFNYIGGEGEEVMGPPSSIRDYIEYALIRFVLICCCLSVRKKRIEEERKQRELRRVQAQEHLFLQNHQQLHDEQLAEQQRQQELILQHQQQDGMVSCCVFLFFFLSYFPDGALLSLVRVFHDAIPPNSNNAYDDSERAPDDGLENENEPLVAEREVESTRNQRDEEEISAATTNCSRTSKGAEITTEFKLKFASILDSSFFDCRQMKAVTVKKPLLKGTSKDVSIFLISDCNSASVSPLKVSDNFQIASIGISQIFFSFLFELLFLFLHSSNL
jgi:hypothetical protein